MRGTAGLLPRVLLTTAIIAGGGLIVYLLAHTVQGIDYHALIRALRHTRPDSLLAALAATGVSFVALIGRDVLALRFIGRKVPALAVLLAGFCGTALGNAVGFGTFTGGAVRYRIYGAMGVKPEEIGRVMLFIAGGFGLGLVGFTAIAVLLESGPVAQLLGWPAGPLRIGAVLTLVASAGLILLCARGPLRIGRRAITLPGPGLAAVQLVLTAVDLLGAAGALWVLLPGDGVNFLEFSAIFSAATALGVISHVPGGIGVFEAVVIFALGRRVPPELVGAALLAYRGIYFGVPLLLSAVLLAVFELRLMAGRGGPVPGLARSAVRLLPSFLAVITFAAGVMLVVSGATPTFGHRLALLSVRLPLWVVEASNFFGSLGGVLLLFIARGLFNRLDGAWWLAVAVAIVSLGLSLAKGLAYGEATILAILILLLLATRRQFRRKASLLAQPFTLAWCVAIGTILLAAIWVLLFAFQDVSYTRDLWWQFEFDAQAPRALRATLGVAILATMLALGQLLRPPKGVTLRPDPADLGRAAAIIRRQGRSDALLALMGDKSLLFSASGETFLMFARRGRSWIALYDPVGPRGEWPELIWRFVELAHSHGGRAAFYQVRPESLPFYLDAGLKVMKLGEEARIPLKSFSLSGGDRAPLRYALKRGEREGLTFELLPPEQVPAVLPALSAISDDWLATRKTGEKSFSVAAFEPGFIRSQSVGLVRQAGRPVAFATLMTTEERQEATIGLMRHRSDASAYAMEFLFTRLILAFKEAGYETFSLGISPLSGFSNQPLASAWHRLGGLISRHGNMLYNFRGLRLFKGKFDPVWEPRYLAASGTIGPYIALADAATLAATAIKGITQT